MRQRRVAIGVVVGVMVVIATLLLAPGVSDRLRYRRVGSGVFEREGERYRLEYRVGRFDPEAVTVRFLRDDDICFVVHAVEGGWDVELLGDFASEVHPPQGQLGSRVELFAEVAVLVGVYCSETGRPAQHWGCRVTQWEGGGSVSDPEEIPETWSGWTP